MACACNVTAQEVHQAFPLCSSSSSNFRNNREGNYDYPTINRDTCVKEPGVQCTPGSFTHVSLTITLEKMIQSEHYISRRLK